MTETPSNRNAVQGSENVHKKLFLNYESPALTAELQAQRANIEQSAQSYAR